MTYRVEFTEPAETELNDAYLWRSQVTSPEAAIRWYRGLKRAVLSLSEWPRQYARVPGSSRYEGEVRRMLYGKGSGAYQVVYRVIEPAEGEDEGIVRILHVYHGASRAAAGDEGAEDEG